MEEIFLRGEGKAGLTEAAGAAVGEKKSKSASKSELFAMGIDVIGTETVAETTGRATGEWVESIGEGFWIGWDVSPFIPFVFVIGSLSATVLGSAYHLNETIALKD